MSLWIKICANTTLADAQLAAEAGADAVGFVFARSPRRVTVEQVAAIVPRLPASLEKIGVFVNAGFDEIVRTVEACGLSGIQLHFAAPAELASRLRASFGAEKRILGVMHFGASGSQSQADVATGHESKNCGKAGRCQGSVTGRDFSRAESSKEDEGAFAPGHRPFDPSIDAVLVDSCSDNATGGTGLAFDWGLAATTVFQNPGACKRIAAGGLTPENVAEAIRILRPWGVDVASGVESAPGRKDAAKVRAFIANARAARHC